MQLVFTAIMLSFLLPSLSYFFTPALAFSQFKQLGALLGATSYPLSEESHLWRILAFGNVFTLATLIFLMQRNIRSFRDLFPVFFVLKSCSALGYLWVWLFQLRYPVFLAVFLFDSLVLIAVSLLGRRACLAVGEPGPADRELVPELS